MSQRGAVNSVLGAALSLVALLAPQLRAQDPARPNPRLEQQAPGEQYDAGGLHRFLLGGDYRSLWTTPVSVPVLDLGTFAGGLKPVSSGGGKQTKSLLLKGADGREFFFRSVDKDASAILPPELRPTVAGSIVRDQTSSAFPTAPPVVGRLLDAVQIPHPDEQLFVLPDDPRLGRFRSDYAGLMGYLQERIGGARGPAAHWKDAAEIIDSDSLLARVDRSPDDRVDTRAFLAARLMDLLVGDWDRHRDQWVWLRRGDALPRRWTPVPRDRDQAFARYDGLLLFVARQTAPQLTNYGPGYPYMAGATWNGRDLDRRFLVDLERTTWDSVANALRSKLTDSVIDHAVRALPPEHYRLWGPRLAAALRARRDRLPDAAGEFYRLLAEEVDVHGTNQPDHAVLTRLPQGGLELTLSRNGAEDEPYFSRRFEPKTTSEVRIFLGEGDDSATTRGRTDGILVRILGGDGQDRLVDSSTSGSERFYDDPRAPKRTFGLRSDVDRRPYTLPPRNPNELPPRDWGQHWALIGWGSFGPDIGLFLGGGATLTTYGFRKYPFDKRHRFRAGFASGPTTYRFDYRGEYRRENSRSYARLLARASGIDVIGFHGFGNETGAPGDREFFRVTQDAFSLEPSMVLAVGSAGELQLGPIIKYVSTDDRPDRFLATLGDLYGTGQFGEIGAGASFRVDTRDRPSAATRGVFLEVGGKVYPSLWNVDRTFGELNAVASTYFTARAPLRPTLALRAGGRKLWGTFPYFEAAFIGDASTVRLGRFNRYAGDAMAHGNAELRLALGSMKVVLPAEVGVFGLADAGRVFLEGESSSEWHTAFGGGVWIGFLERAHTLSAAVASSDERTGVYIQAGFGF